VGRKKTSDTRAHGVSVNRERQVARARPGGLLGSAQAGRGEGREMGRAQKGGRAMGCRLRWVGPKPRREMKILFFFFSQNFKAFSNEILKFYLSFQIEHTIQNVMQQHECSIMFLPLYLILN
jgi:hypothetical protein